MEFDLFKEIERFLREKGFKITRFSYDAILNKEGFIHFKPIDKEEEIRQVTEQ